MATKLDKFIQEKKEISFELKGKTYIGKTNALTLLDVMAVMNDKDLPESEQMSSLFNCIFGKENAKELFAELTLEGISAVAAEIVEALGIKTEGK